MSRIRKWSAVSATVLLMTVLGSASNPEAPCEQSLYGAGFRVHARFTVYTGDGQEVLWPVGTHRLLRVVSDTEPLYRAIMGKKEYEIHEFVEMAGEYVVFGDFEVCPLQKDVPGAMRSVCIKKAEHLKRVRQQTR